MAILALSTALLVGFGAVGLEATTGAQAEISGGSIPDLGGSGDNDLGLVMSFAPFLTGAARTRRQSFELTYAPRLTLRSSGHAVGGEPALLHAWLAAHAHRLARRTNWQSTATAEYGLVDTLQLRDTLETEDAGTLQTSRLGLVGLRAETGLLHACSRRYTAGPILSWQSREYHDGGEGGEVPFPSSRVARAGLRQTLAVTAVDQLGLDLGAARTEYSPGARHDSLEALFDWRRQLGPQATTRASFGAAAIRTDEGGETTGYPLAAAGATARLGTLARWRLSGSGDLSYSATLNQLSGLPQDAFGATLGLSGRSPPWTLRASGGAQRTLSRSTATGAESWSTHSVEVAAIREQGRETTLSFGARATTRRSLDPADSDPRPEVYAVGFIAVSAARAVAGRHPR